MIFAGLMSRCSTRQRVGIVDRVADVDEPAQELAELERLLCRGRPVDRRIAVKPPDRLPERVPLDEPHGVVGPAAFVSPQAVDRDDAGVFQPAGDLGLEQEPTSAVRVVRVRVEDLLQRHLAVELGVEGDKDRPQTAPGVGPQHAEPQAIIGGGADGIAGRAVRVVIGGGAEVGESVFDRGVGQRGEVLTCVKARAGMAARFFPASPPWASRCIAASGLDDRSLCSAVRYPRATRWSASGRPCRRSKHGTRRRGAPAGSIRSTGRAGRKSRWYRRQPEQLRCVSVAARGLPHREWPRSDVGTAAARLYTDDARPASLATDAQLDLRWPVVHMPSLQMVHTGTNAHHRALVFVQLLTQGHN